MSLKHVCLCISLYTPTERRLFIPHQTLWVCQCPQKVYAHSPATLQTRPSWSHVISTCRHSTTHAMQCTESVCIVVYSDCSAGSGITTPALVCCNKRSTAFAAAAPCIAGAGLPGQPRCRYAKYALHIHANVSTAALLRWKKVDASSACPILLMLRSLSRMLCKLKHHCSNTQLPICQI